MVEHRPRGLPPVGRPGADVTPGPAGRGGRSRRRGPAAWRGCARTVRDSKDPSRGALLFTAPAWAAFVGGVRREAAGGAA
ncbi:DUF397 domain-containing protein [Streptomyces mutabilis]|uniref:DUF397 domain-containing protein n=1 Tax=Streptomyces mutabilis TaxID=67332 RepID=UPI0022BA6204|nr:DUF397 domain-containing protein [Streptomyces mutabilis]MCZ9349873.1 DUF397 domain-containing protein [Streptomyces mutabilis]